MGLSWLQEGETADSWLSILGGMTELCVRLTDGLRDTPEEALCERIVAGDELSRLHEMAPSPEGRADVLIIAAALTAHSPAAREMQLRYVDMPPANCNLAMKPGVVTVAQRVIHR